MIWKAAILVVLALISGGAPAHAADDPPPSPWEFEFAPYAWIPGTFGTITVHDVGAKADVTVKDMLDIVTSGNGMAAGSYFGLRYDRFEAFADGFGGFIKAGETLTVRTRLCTATIAGEVETRPVFVDVGVGYRIGQWVIPGRQHPLTLGAYVGTRYTHIGTQINASRSVANVGLRRAAAVSESFDWADPMLGVRTQVPLLDNVAFDFRGDIGGFDVSSKLIWGIVADLRYQMAWRPLSVHPYVSAGYRAISLDHDFGAGSSADLQFRGPLSAFGFTF